MSKISISNIKSKKGGDPIICLTAYSHSIAKILDQYCDIILVGDSLGMVLYGMKDTLSVSVDMMINHGKAVVNATNRAVIVVDLPYGSYEKSTQQAYETALRVMNETGCDAVKLECSHDVIDIVKFLVQKGIPVMGHVGLLPQHVNEMGGYKCQGRSEDQAKVILENAFEVEKAGVFSVVIEGVIESLASKISSALSIPTIGIGASVDCDGQILVSDDLLGINQEFKPKFAKNYADLGNDIQKAVKEYAQDVKDRKFPKKEHCFY